MSQIYLTEALKLPDKTTANIVCTITTAELKLPPGKHSYWNGKVSDEANTCYLSSFGPNLGNFLGKKVILSGAEVGSYNGKKQLTLGKRGAITDFVDDFEAAPQPQKPPQKAASDRLHQYKALYSACIGAARNTCNEASFTDDPETLRQIATCYFIQGLKEGIKVDANLTS